ncbi:hypothetical protein [Acinetobacter populi]|uniref:Uncharacterized protein n=1 Tax=Acinetobacter populi TaxID=1582270 RepID=A0A1Z9Z1K0_9GAMM|nr:hypothetical protein [Acinetobacter populi]OUY08316.1 hypothetical protein CAP51_01450 [Acinetobacter populi]
MKSMILKAACLSALCYSGMALAATDELSKAEVQKQIQVCNKKTAGDLVSYAYKGVTFNGTCQQNAEGKLQFQPPVPTGSEGAGIQEQNAAAPALDAPSTADLPANAPQIPDISDDAPQAQEGLGDQQLPVEVQ